MGGHNMGGHDNRKTQQLEYRPWEEMTNSGRTQHLEDTPWEDAGKTQQLEDTPWGHITIRGHVRRTRQLEGNLGVSLCHRGRSEDQRLKRSTVWEDVPL